MSTPAIKLCSRDFLDAYLKNQLEEEYRLDFLFHLDMCPRCWEEVYNATKASHPHFYKKAGKKMKISSKELVKANASQMEDEVFEVA